MAFEAPADTAARARDYLISVFDNPDETISDRMEALKLSRKCEAAKVTPRTVRTTQREGDRREAWRRYKISQRHSKLSLAIRDTPPKGWADDLYSDAYEAPDGWPPPWS